MPFKGSVRLAVCALVRTGHGPVYPFLCRIHAHKDSFLGSYSMAQLFWCAPEVMRNLPYTEKSDVYSFGIMMWEVLTRENLYPGLHPLSVGYKVRTQRTFRNSRLPACFSPSFRR